MSSPRSSWASPPSCSRRWSRCRSGSCRRCGATRCSTTPPWAWRSSASRRRRSSSASCSSCCSRSRPISSRPPGAGDWKNLVLPALTLGAFTMASIARLTRSAVLEVLGADYIRTARAKGVSEIWVVAKHTLKNAAIPIVTITGLQFGTLLGGAVVTETVFAWPGIGRLAVQSIYNRDYPVVQCTVFLAGGDVHRDQLRHRPGLWLPRSPHPFPLTRSHRRAPRRRGSASTGGACPGLADRGRRLHRAPGARRAGGAVARAAGSDSPVAPRPAGRRRRSTGPMGVRISSARITSDATCSPA